MAHVEKGGSPHGALEPVRPSYQETDRTGANLSALFMQEQQGGKERSHEELVAIIRVAMEKRRAFVGAYGFDPAEWIRNEITFANSRRILAETPVHTEEALDIELGKRPYAKLIMAWDIIAYRYYKDDFARDGADRGLRERAKIQGQTITLDPTENKLLDAMAEAVGIPNPYGQLPKGKKALK